jgi:calmodulin
MGPKKKEEENQLHIPLVPPRKNANGGVLVSRGEIDAAFNFLDAEKRGKISIGNLKKKLTPFFPDLTGKDFKYLMDGKKELVVDDIVEMLEGNEIHDFDPVVEAFKTYDPEGRGYIEKERLKEVFATFGFGELTAEELKILTDAADVDGDGVVSLNDFRMMMDTPITATEESIKSNQQDESSVVTADTNSKN